MVLVWYERYINKRFAFKNFGISCLALIFTRSNSRTTIKKSIQGCKIRVIRQVMYHCTVFFSSLIWTYGLVVMASSSKSRDLGSIPAKVWIPLQPLGHFAWLWALQCTDTRLFMCRASEQKWQKVIGPWFSLNCRKYSKTTTNSVGFLTLIPQTGISQDEESCPPGPTCPSSRMSPTYSSAYTWYIPQQARTMPSVFLSNSGICSVHM